MVTTLTRCRNIDFDVDIDALHRQHDFYMKLKEMYPKKLKDLHEKTFKGTKWWHVPPRGVETKLLKEWLIRRIWIFYAVKNYHFPKGSEFRTMFMRRAKKVLSNKLASSDALADQVLSDNLKDAGWISKEGIASLSNEEVDQLLTQYGVNFTDDIPSEQRRYALWELYTKPGSKTLKQKPASSDKRGEKQVAAKRPSKKGGPSLRSAIIHFPYLSYKDFVKKLGKKFPTTSSSSFAMTKSVLRGEGYNIPILDRSGDSAPKCEPATKSTKKSTKKAARKTTIVKGVTVPKKAAAKKSKKKAKRKTKR